MPLRADDELAWLPAPLQQRMRAPHAGTTRQQRQQHRYRYRQHQAAPWLAVAGPQLAPTVRALVDFLAGAGLLSSIAHK
ncbi:hypothetical protein [Janthinobacterium sp. AD80]|uniref:hypothetical protein n=1 Tax=Janthinobacterium sp. AD80 TaxID=1528773 RepID=UPI0015E09E77|nr:hypothetical protein [Janthinobacterium sp. AD80]